MTNSDKKDSLKNKFQVAEISVDPDLKFKLSEASFQSLVQERKNNEKGAFFWLTSLLRFTKIVFKLSLDFSSFVWREIAKPSYKILLKTLSATYKNLKVQKERREISIGNYLKDVESRIDLREAKMKMDEIDSITASEEYENGIRKKFEEGLCNVAVTAEKSEYKKAAKSLAYDLGLFEFMADKLTEGRLVSNIDYMTISSTVEKLEMVHVVEFELKVAGLNWSTVFSKFIGSQIYNKIDWVQGKTEGHHIHNVTQIKDTFIFTFSHQRLELQDMAQDLKKYSEILETPLFDFDLQSIKNENNQDI